MGNKASVESTPEQREANGWDNSTDKSTHHGWGSIISSDGINDQGWLDKSIKARDNGWGESVIESSDSTGKGSSSKPAPPEVSSSGWGDEPAKEECKGWLKTPAKTEFNGWINEPDKDEYKGWKVTENTQIEQPLVNPTLVPLAPPSAPPSAPPLPEEVLAHYPSVGTKAHETSEISDVREEKSSLCIICWERPVEGACVPCGHMSGCMTCLTEIKSRKGDCPVCRAKIDQIIKLYAV